MKAILSNRFQIFKRLHTAVDSKTPIPVKSLKIFEHGRADKVLQIVEEELQAEHDNQVLVKMLAAPIHAVDIDFVTGRRPALFANDKSFPLVPGTEGVAEIASVGGNVKDLTVGQRVVIPFANSISSRGTWSTYAIYDAKFLLPIPQEMQLNDAAQLAIFPCTAYQLLTDFISLRYGDCVFFNGGNTPLGRSLIQLCKANNLKCVCVVRQINSTEVVMNHLKMLGADEVIPETELMTTDVFESGAFPRPKLVVNCVPRSSSRLLGRYMDRKGVMATYGFIAGYPAITVTAPLIFKDFVMRPFWIVRYNENRPDREERASMYSYLCTKIEEEALKLPKLREIPFMKYKVAFEELKQHVGSRQSLFLLDMRGEV